MTTPSSPTIIDTFETRYGQEQGTRLNLGEWIRTRSNHATRAEALIQQRLQTLSRGCEMRKELQTSLVMINGFLATAQLLQRQP